MSNLESHGDARALFRLDLLAEHTVEEVKVGRLGPCRVIEHRIETLGNIAQAQPQQLLGHARVDDGAHRSPPAITAA